MNTTPKNDTEGTYRVSFRLADEGHYRFLQSSKVVTAPSRAKAVASVKGGTGAEVIEWGPEDPEMQHTLTVKTAPLPGRPGLQSRAECSCGWQSRWTEGSATTAHRQHVAASHR